MLNSYKRLTNSLVDIVNSQRNLSRRTRNALVSKEQRTQFRNGVKLAVDSGLTLDLISEVSIRIHGGKIMATVEAAYLSDLQDEQIGYFSQKNSKSLENKLPPRHLKWHQSIYSYETIHAGLFCQPAAALWAASQEKLPNLDLLLDAKSLISSLAFVAPDEESIDAVINTAGALLIPHHGLFVWGVDLYQAVAKAQIINRICEIEMFAHQGHG